MSDDFDPEIDYDPAKFLPGTFGCHEALHTASILMSAVDSHLCQHPAVKLNPEWQALADQALHTLFELYQAIGKAHL